MNFLNKVFSVALSTLLVVSSFSVANAEESKFKEGEHYRSIESNQLSETQEMKEFFSYYCGHCFMFRSVWDGLKSSYPKVEFKKVPVAFLGGPNGPLSQKAFAVASTLEVEEAFTNELFNQIHKMRKTELSAESLADIAAYVGADRAAFLQSFNSFMALSMTASYNQETDKNDIAGVPTILVNNKYVILKAEKDEMNDLITYLLTKDGVPEVGAKKEEVKSEEPKAEEVNSEEPKADAEPTPAN